MKQRTRAPKDNQQVCSDWEAVLTTFLSTLNSPGPRDNYRRAIKSAMKEMGSLESLTADALTQHRESLIRRLDCPAKQDGRVLQRLSTTTESWRLIALADYPRFARLTAHVDIPLEVICNTPVTACLGHSPVPDSHWARTGPVGRLY